MTTTHRHQDSRKLWTTTVTDPDLSPYALVAALNALTARVAKLEAAVPPPVVVPPPVPPPVVPPPVVPPVGRPFPAPVTTNVVQVTAGANVQSVVNGAPDGTEFRFAAGAVYQLLAGIYLRNRHNLVFVGNGATIQSTGPGGSTASSGFKLDNLNSDIAIRDFNLVGSNPSTGTDMFHPGSEGQHGVIVWDSQRVEVDNCRISHVYGDGFYVGGWNTSPYRPSQDVWVHDSSFDYIGRMGLVPNYVDRFIYERNTIDHVGLIAIDIEPDNAWEGVTNMYVRDNTIGAYSMSGTQTNWFFANAAVHGCHHANHVVERNTVTVGALTNANNPANKGGLATRVTTTDRVNGLIFRDNTTTVPGGGNTYYLATLNFQHVDGLTVTGNVQPMSGGTKVAIVDCPFAVLSPNP